MHTCLHRIEISADMELETAKACYVGSELVQCNKFCFVQMFGQNAGFLGFNIFKSAVESQVFQSVAPSPVY